MWLLVLPFVSARLSRVPHGRTPTPPGYQLLDVCSPALSDDDLLGKEGKFIAKTVELWGFAFPDATKEDKEVLRHYADQCFNGYKRDVVYHNARHAFDVYQFFLRTFAQVAENALPLKTKQSVALALLCHDFGHPGLPNKFVGPKIKEAHAGAAEGAATPDAWRALLSDGQLEAMDAILAMYSGQDTDEAKWAGAFIGYGPANVGGAEDPAGLVPSDAVWAKGCAGAIDAQQEPAAIAAAAAGACSSLEERFHAAKGRAAFEAALAAVPGSTLGADLVAGLAHAIEATDMGEDVLQKRVLLRGPVLAELPGILAHLSDISAASGKEQLCWSMRVNTEFAHEAAVGEGAVSAPEAKDPAGVQHWLGVESGWGLGILKFADTVFGALNMNQAVFLHEPQQHCEETLLDRAGLGGQGVNVRELASQADHSTTTRSRAQRTLRRVRAACQRVVAALGPFAPADATEFTVELDYLHPSAEETFVHLFKREELGELFAPSPHFLARPGLPPNPALAVVEQALANTKAMASVLKDIDPKKAVSDDWIAEMLAKYAPERDGPEVRAELHVATHYGDGLGAQRDALAAQSEALGDGKRGALDAYMSLVGGAAAYFGPAAAAVTAGGEVEERTVRKDSPTVTDA